MKLEQTKLINKLVQVWTANPTLRFGQLIDNARSAGAGNMDLFYVSDEDLMSGLEKLKQ